MNDCAARKASVRRQVLAARHAMGAAARQVAAQRIGAQIAAMPQYQQAHCVAGFAPMPEEVDIWPLLNDCLQQQKTVALPRIADKKNGTLAFHRLRSRAHLRPGAMGIYEPAAEEEIISAQLFDFIFVPAVAIGQNKKRLGYGGGFYDRVLLNCSAACSCAPVFRCQIAEALPCENHDQSVHFVVSE